MLNQGMLSCTGLNFTNVGRRSRVIMLGSTKLYFDSVYRKWIKSFDSYAVLQRLSYDSLGDEQRPWVVHGVSKKSRDRNVILLSSRRQLSRKETREGGEKGGEGISWRMSWVISVLMTLGVCAWPWVPLSRLPLTWTIPGCRFSHCVRFRSPPQLPHWFRRLG